MALGAPDAGQPAELRDHRLTERHAMSTTPPARSSRCSGHHHREPGDGIRGSASTTSTTLPVGTDLYYRWPSRCYRVRLRLSSSGSPVSYTINPTATATDPEQPDPANLAWSTAGTSSPSATITPSTATQLPSLCSAIGSVVTVSGGSASTSRPAGRHRLDHCGLHAVSRVQFSAYRPACRSPTPTLHLSHRVRNRCWCASLPRVSPSTGRRHRPVW